MLASFSVQTVYKIDLLEHSTRTDALIRIHATDGDEGDYGVVRYSVNDPYFRIDGVTVSCICFGGQQNNETVCYHYETPLRWMDCVWPVIFFCCITLQSIYTEIRMLWSSKRM